MMASVDAIKELREMTSCGVIECKKALEEAKGDIEKAKQILQKRGLEIAAKKGSRTAKEGRVESYIHLGNKIGVIVEVNCETDFVAKNEDFCAFTKDVAMHIAATSPSYLKEADIPQDVLASQKDKNLFLKEQCLLAQPFVKDEKTSVENLVKETIAKTGENIKIDEFYRLEL